MVVHDWESESRIDILEDGEPVNVFWSRCKEVFSHNIIIQRFVKTLRAREGGSSQGGPRSGTARHSEARGGDDGDDMSFDGGDGFDHDDGEEEDEDDWVMPGDPKNRTPPRGGERRSKRGDHRDDLERRAEGQTAASGAAAVVSPSPTINQPGVKEGEAAGGPGAAKGASYLDDVRRALLSAMAEGEGADEAAVLEAYQALMQEDKHYLFLINDAEKAGISPTKAASFLLLPYARRQMQAQSKAS